MKSNKLTIIICLVFFTAALLSTSALAATRDVAGAVELFTTVPVELYKFCIDLQGSFSQGLTSLWQTGGSLSTMAIGVLSSPMFAGFSPLVALFVIILIGYAVIKVFFANLKRGGILLIQIAAGSLYMFSVPRGYIDGFTGWCKQIIGLMLAATEIPRIAGQFGLDTSTKGNLMGAVNAR